MEEDEKVGVDAVTTRRVLVPQRTVHLRQVWSAVACRSLYWLQLELWRLHCRGSCGSCRVEERPSEPRSPAFSFSTLFYSTQAAVDTDRAPGWITASCSTSSRSASPSRKPSCVSPASSSLAWAYTLALQLSYRLAARELGISVKDAKECGAVSAGDNCSGFRTDSEGLSAKQIARRIPRFGHGQGTRRRRRLPSQWLPQVRCDWIDIERQRCRRHGGRRSSVHAAPVEPDGRGGRATRTDPHKDNDARTGGRARKYVRRRRRMHLDCCACVLPPGSSG